ncbi:hypothetical protein [Lacticaseibacillus sp. GG6-2]
MTFPTLPIDFSFKVALLREQPQPAEAVVLNALGIRERAIMPWQVQLLHQLLKYQEAGHRPFLDDFRLLHDAYGITRFEFAAFVLPSTTIATTLTQIRDWRVQNTNSFAVTVADKQAAILGETAPARYAEADNIMRVLEATGFFHMDDDRFVCWRHREDELADIVEHVDPQLLPEAAYAEAMANPYQPQLLGDDINYLIAKMGPRMMLGEDSYSLSVIQKQAESMYNAWRSDRRRVAGFMSDGSDIADYNYDAMTALKAHLERIRG